uniref:Glycoside hydrolase family 99-like domain-containing protein n=1 Tax=Prevotella sp. GTC17259 TaxID=3236795 RepID=A0AB33JA10_9BACT
MSYKINDKARAIAFYLPQFHEIPENNEWWGKGFTEWTSVKNGKPLFKEHVQPKIPGELGYYNLLDPVVREKQAQLAREAGIEGFCYWHYWFGNGKRLLEKPFQEVLTSGKPDFPFCLCWANHTWARTTWVNIQGKPGKQILMEQTYPGDEDIKLHFMTCLPAFKDSRYIRVDEKPIFGIWAPFDIPNFRHFKEMWNKMAEENGLKGIHLIGLTDGWISRNQKALDLGFDAICPTYFWNAELRTNRIKTLLFSQLHKKFNIGLMKYKYKDIIKNWFTTEDRREEVYPCIIPNYDRSPRGGRKSVMYYGATPELFKQHVEEAIDIISAKHPQHRVMFIRSWNEWGEGNYLEPDQEFGRGFLDVLQDSLK